MVYIKRFKRFMEYGVTNMRLTYIRNTFLAAIVFLSGLTGAQASTAPVLDTTGFLSATNPATILPFIITVPGKYDLTLTDFGALSGGLFTSFAQLGALITKPSSPVFSFLAPTPGTYTQIGGTTLAAGNYFAVVGGILETPSATLPTGVFGISIAQSVVSLPPSVLLLGSAFAGLIGLGRRRTPQG